MIKSKLLFAFYGLVVGIVVSMFFFGDMIETANYFKDENILTSWQDKTTKAYLYEKPGVAIWALKNFIDILEERQERLDSTRSDLNQIDLALSYGRLALIWEKNGNTDKYEIYLNKGYLIAKQCLSKRVKTKEDLLSFIHKTDSIEKKRFDTQNQEAQ